MSDIVVAILLLAGGVFAALAGIGIARMPDLLTRMQAATKAGTLGIGLLCAAAAVHYASIDTAIRAGLIVLFLFLTAPVGAHLLSRAAHRRGIRLTSRTKIDDLTQHRHRGYTPTPPPPPPPPPPPSPPLPPPPPNHQRH
jgi:multicomponent Na+:H+ antiporter subunit G